MLFWAYSSSGLPEKRCGLNAMGVCATAIENYLTPVLTFGCSGFKHKFEIRRSMPTNHDDTLEARESL
jgi:hypothetical protein